MDQSLRDALFIGSDSRANFKNVIAKRSDLVQFATGRMVAPGADNTVYEAGTVLGQVTSAGPTQYQLKPYNSANTDGSQVAVGVLSESTIADINGDGTKIVMIRKGCLYLDKLIAPDAGWKTQLSAKAYVEGGENLIDVG